MLLVDEHVVLALSVVTLHVTYRRDASQELDISTADN